MIFKYKFNNAYFFNLSNNTKKKKKSNRLPKPTMSKKEKAEIEGQFGEGERRLRKRVQHSNIK